MSFIRKSVLNVFGTGLYGIVNLIIGVILARLLKPEGIGQYQLVLSAVTIAGAIAAFGVGGASVYFINRQKQDPREISTIAFKFSAISGIVIAAALFFILRLKSYFGDIPLATICITAACGAAVLLTENLYPLLLVTFQVRRHLEVKLAPRLFLLAFLVLGYKFELVTVNSALVYSSVGYFLGVALLLWYIRDWLTLDYIQTSLKHLKSLLNYGTRLNLSYVVTLLNGEIGILLLRFFKAGDFAQVGYYSRAIRLGGMILLLAASMGPLLLSKWTAAKHMERQMQVEKTCRTYCFFLILAILPLELFADRIVLLLYGEEFSSAIPMTRILLIGIGTRSLLNPLFQLFSSGGRPLLTTVVLAANLVIMLAIMVFVVPYYGGKGASVAFTVSNCLALILGYYFSSSKFDIRVGQCLIIKMNDLKYLVKTLKT